MNKPIKQMTNRIFWIYVLQKGSSYIFLYGLSLPTSHSHIMSKPKYLGKLSSGWKIQLYTSIQNINISAIFSNNTIDFLKINKNLPLKTVFYYHNKVIQFANHMLPQTPPSPIDSVTDVDIYYSDQFMQHSDCRELSVDEFMNLCKTLDNDRQKFSDIYVERLGCFEWAETKEWAEEMLPFKLIVKKKEVFFYRKENNKNWKVHLVLYSNRKEILLDTLLNIDIGVTEYTLPIAHILSNIAEQEYWIFDEENSLLHHEKVGFISAVSGNIIVLSDSISIKDKMATKDKRLERVVSTNRSSWQTPILLPKEEQNANLWKQELVKKSSLAKQVLENGCWFHKHNKITKLTEIYNLVEYFNKITQSSSATILIIIDPFISQESLSLLARLTDTHLRIQIISCWRAENPDNPGEKANIDKIIKDTKNALKRLKALPLAISFSQWYNLPTAKFHDRFVVVKTNQGNNIYMLSNSINNLLKDYDFCIVPLNGKTKLEAEAYINSLLSLCNEKNRIF